jgi:hypothetical protein
VILHPNAVVSPHDCCSAGRSTGRDMGTALGRFGLLGELGCEPIEGRRRG